MLRILAISDLHLEFSSLSTTFPDADLVILAGDIDMGLRGVEWACRTFPTTPVIYVPGNHEFYRKAYPRLVEKMRAAATNSTVNILDRDCLEIGGVTFLGCTLWSDYALLGEPSAVMDHCARHLTDFQLIRISPKYYRMTPQTARSLNATAIAWLTDHLPRAQRAVVVTHHAPSARSFGSEDYRHTPESAGFASNLDPLILQYRPELWIHGHIHSRADYLVGNTRVLCNPRGYPDERNDFNPSLIIEI